MQDRHSTQSKTRQFHNKPEINTAILRTNKKIYSNSKSYLDTENKWVVFDIYGAYILLPWVYALVPITMIDSRDHDAKIPRSVMQVRVKIYPTYLSHLAYRQAESRGPVRGFVLVRLEDFEMFLLFLRQVDLCDSLRVVPGDIFNSRGSQATTAMVGFHGSNIRVPCEYDYPADQTQKLLEKFRMFHGPLNEITIIGAPDSARALNIEASITVPRHTTYETTFH